MNACGGSNSSSPGSGQNFEWPMSVQFWALYPTPKPMEKHIAAKAARRRPVLTAALTDDCFDVRSLSSFTSSSGTALYWLLDIFIFLLLNGRMIEMGRH
ncbi:uncharacterized protein LY89DRAFT_213058 [Mollisia scopiformis]|uniref:Uncharacterized protein n=1 Tax=Mollisia scopiformis TaxID=149040 RepID=A0A194WV19_MOLSC|nr:uncharacterized protein LY89DRAFT_213058 [Mollisia scopiformis]KUJ11813.1 hypothetical protein LY89DRAFT_213058 [Mollisia scopiformis]